MTWLRVDDDFESHPKVIALGRQRERAVYVWLMCGLWCAKQRTDGYVPPSVVRGHDPRLRYAQRLVDVRLWVPVHEDELPPHIANLAANWQRTGRQLAEPWFLFWQWEQRNPTRNEIENKRRQTAERVARWRKNRAGQSIEDGPDDEPGNGVTSVARNAVTNTVTTPTGNRVTDPPCNAAPHPTPISTTPPDVGVVLTNPPALRAGPPTRKRTATPIPDDFAVTDAMAEWARTNAPDVSRSETDRFVDYWRAKPGRDGTKTDWPATWRNWMRREQDRHNERRHTNGTRLVTGSRRADKALSALDPDDPYLTQYVDRANNHPPTIQGGQSP